MRTYLAAASKIPMEGTRMECTRFVRGDGFVSSEIVLTSRVTSVVQLGEKIYEVNTENSKYLVFCENEASWDIPVSEQIGTKQYIGISSQMPREGTHLHCIRVVDNTTMSYPMTEDVWTSKVRKVTKLDGHIYEARTLNSIYYVLCHNEQ